MGEPKHQHFIPRSYLKYFGVKVKDNYVVDTIMRGKNSQIMQLTTTNVCVDKNIYTFPLNTPGDRFALEKFYAVHVDGVYPEVYDMLVNSNISVIGQDDKRKILNTILSLYFRTPHFLNAQNETLDLVLDQIAAEEKDLEKEHVISLEDGVQLKFQLKDLEEIRANTKVKYKEKFLIAHFADWQDYVNYKMTCAIEVITVSQEIPLITSDNPVLIMDLGGILNNPNIFHPDNIIEIPINRAQYVIVYPNSAAEGAQLKITRNFRDQYFAAAVNRRIQDNSEIRLISHLGDLKTHFESQINLEKETPENLEILENMKRKAILARELLQVIEKNGSRINQEVADKVREIRKSRLMDDDLALQQLIYDLARNGYLTM